MNMYGDQAYLNQKQSNLQVNVVGQEQKNTMTFVNQYGNQNQTYNDNNMINLNNFYQNQNVMSSWNFKSIYRDSYENQDLKNIIFNGHSPGTMLKIP